MYFNFTPWRSCKPAPLTTFISVSLGRGFKWKRCWNRSKWGLTPKKASKRWTKIEIWRMEFGVKWCTWIPQWCKIPRKKFEVGIPRLRRTWEWKITDSFLLSWGNDSPTDFCQWTTSRGWRRSSSTRPKRWKSEHLLGFHPRFSASSAALPAFPFR